MIFSNPVIALDFIVLRRAIAALKILQHQGWAISDAAIQTGMAQAQWLGRLHRTQWQGMDLLVDGAHNPAAAKALRQYMDATHVGSVHWLVGMLSTKDHADIFEALLRKGDRLTLVPVPEHSSADPQELADLGRSVCPSLSACDTAPSLFDGLKQLQMDSITPAPLKVLCGSLYLVGEFYRKSMSL